MSAVQIQLLDLNFNVVAVTYTNAFGDYTFNHVAEGQYRLRVIAPTEGTFSPKDAANDSIDSDFDGFGYGDVISVFNGDVYDFDGGIWFEPPDLEPPTP